MSPKKTRAVFLDRDGVLNRAVVIDGKPHSPENVAAVEIPPDVPAALEALSAANFLLIVITNQPNVMRGLTSQADVEEINNHLAACLPIDEFRTCYHDDTDECHCRKPAPGALLRAAEDYDIDLSNSYMVGDRWRDVEAGQRAGCKTVFIDYGYNEKQPETVDFRVKTLLEASTVILKNSEASK